MRSPSEPPDGNAVHQKTKRTPSHHSPPPSLSHSNRPTRKNSQPRREASTNKCDARPCHARSDFVRASDSARKKALLSQRLVYVCFSQQQLRRNGDYIDSRGRIAPVRPV
jgi:hypothetical protein